MSSEHYPNQLRLAWKSLRELERLEETVSRPLTNVVNRFRFKARALLGMVLLYSVSPLLRLDFRAIMTLAGITREGAFDSHGVRLPDPDQRKRKELRNLMIIGLGNAQLLKTEQVYYEDSRSIQEARRVLEHGPAEGIVCWTREALFFKTRPTGLRTSVHALKIRQIETINWQAVKDELSGNVHLSTIDLCKQEMESVYESLLDLFQKNKIDPLKGSDVPASQKPQFDTKQITMLAYLMAAVEEPRGAAKRMTAVLPLIRDDIERTQRPRSAAR
jgi:hypothetical protein